MYSSDHNFDAIIWVSAKSSTLTVGEIQRIEGAITSSVGIFESVATFEPGLDSPMKRVEKLLLENNVLLFIDNLETVIDEKLREFAENIPGESKIVFTSRVPLGSDLIVRVGEFSESEALIFLRRLIQAYSIHALEKVDNSVLRKYVTRLSCKPLLVKWFAMGVLTGLSPESIVRDPQIALKFCLENVVDTLDRNTQFAALAFALLPGRHSAVIIQYTTKLRPQEVEDAIVALLRYGIVEDTSQSSQERTYTMRAFPRAYLLRLGQSRKEQREYILARDKTLKGEFQANSADYIVNVYDPKRFTVRSRSEMVVVGHLRQALMHVRRGEADEGQKILKDLMITASEYFEIYRVSAFIAVQLGDDGEAYRMYDAALEISPDQPQLHFWFAGFLMRYRSDYEGAASAFERALKLDGQSGVVLREAARNKLFDGKFDEAMSLLETAKNLPTKTYRDSIIFADISAQVHIRKAEFLLKLGDFEGSLKALESLRQEVSDLDNYLVDATMVEHVCRTNFTAQTLNAKALTHIRDRVSDYLRWLSSWSGTGSASRLVNPGLQSENVILHCGVLKESGRKPSFGFLSTDTHSDVFVHRSAVSPDLWDMMCGGEQVSFEVVHKEDGKNHAANVRLA